MTGHISRLARTLTELLAAAWGGERNPIAPAEPGSVERRAPPNGSGPARRVRRRANSAAADAIPAAASGSQASQNGPSSDGLGETDR